MAPPVYDALMISTEEIWWNPGRFLICATRQTLASSVRLERYRLPQTRPGLSLSYRSQKMRGTFT